ncbi:MAG: cell wall-binding repeat-containing protein [Acidimicrobiaceae bacterium]|nr:cell wall-binding repeat-containing protein [Acidimicrobiaceae bacterium]
MTIYSKRRGGRSLAAIAAAMLMASVLAVVAGSPAQAANTSREYLVDTDDDSVPDAREFAGRDRYQTAVKLAERFAKDRGGLGAVQDAFVASGESLVDAVSVAGLAGFLDAPVLLTPSDSLHGGVKDFVEDYGVGSIHVLGGTAAVSDDVLEEIEGLSNSPTVTRTAGDNRYTTAAMIAGELQGESWCGTNENSAIIASGADDALFDAVAIGPIANRLELPMLLTDGEMLVDEVLSHIDDGNVEYVVIVGGTGSVGAAVESALADAGVDTVKRIAGDSPAAISSAIAKVIADECEDDLSPVSTNVVALVNSQNVIDGITAGPVLADDTDQLGGGLIPILAVGDTLPASVRDYLAATPQEDSSGDKIEMRILAIGGTAAVSDAVVAAAVEAAASAEALTVRIAGPAFDDTDDNHTTPMCNNPERPVHPDRDAANGQQDWICLHFSDDVFREATETVTGIRNRLEDILEVNDVPADIVTGAGADAACAPDVVPVRLARDLSPGDVIDIVEGNVLVGADPDQRILRPTSVTVTTPAADLRRPVIQIVALNGQTQLFALAQDPGLPSTGLDTEAPGAGLLAGTGMLTDDNGNVLFERTAGDVGITGVTESVPADRHDGRTLLTFTLGDVTGTDATETGALDLSDAFRANRGALRDLGGPWPNTNDPNESQVTTSRTVNPVRRLQVSSVQMSELNHGMQGNQPMVVVPSAHRGDAVPTARHTDANPAVWLEARADEAAAGAFGNAWRVRVDKATRWDGAKDVELRVFVSERDRRIGIRIVNGEPRFADLRAALEANDIVNRLFLVRVDNQFNGDVNTCRAANDKLRHASLPVVGADTGSEDEVNLAGGTTVAAVHVNFNGWVEEITAGESARLLTHVLAGALQRNQPAVGELTEETLRTGLSIANQNVFLKAAASGPVMFRRLNIVTQTASFLPAPRDLVEIPDGFDKILTGDDKGKPVDAEAATDGTQRQDTDQSSDGGPGTTSIANGYGDNHSDGTTDNDFNYGSESRIVRSAAVTAPLWSAFS